MFPGACYYSISFATIAVMPSWIRQRILMNRKLSIPVQKPIAAVHLPKNCKKWTKEQIVKVTEAVRSGSGINHTAKYSYRQCQIEDDIAYR